MNDKPTMKQPVPEPTENLSIVGARKKLGGSGQAYATGYDSRWPSKREQNTKK